MPHHIDTAPQIESAGEPGRVWARPASAGTPAGWPALDPSLLEDGRPVVPAFPLDTVPQPWREWVSDTACGAGAPVDYVAQAVLGAVAGLCGAGVKACVTPSWSEPPLAGAGRRAVGRQDAGPGRDRPPARHRRDVAAAGRRRRGQPYAGCARPCARRKGLP